MKRLSLSDFTADNTSSTTPDANSTTTPDTSASELTPEDKK